MKYKKLVLLFLLLTSALAFTACGRETAADASAVEQEENKEEEKTGETEETEELETENPEAADAEASALEETDPANADEETGNGLEEKAQEASPEMMQFTVDITDNMIEENGMVIGNTAAEDNYAGIIEIHLPDALAEKAAAIEVGKTYVFTVEPMMTMSIPPQVTATDFKEATEEDIRIVEEVRENISTFKDCMKNYEDMSLEQIINDANFNYALWTQEEIKEYMQFIEEKGYTGSSALKSYAVTRDQLNGSIILTR